MLAVAFASCVSAGCRRSVEPPSVLLVVIDTLRADRLGKGARDGAAAAMPALDDWARDASVFRRATTPAPFTMPAMAAVFTGAWPDRTGVAAHEPGTTLALWSGATLAETARAAGLATSAVIANPWLARERTGFDRGFDRYLRLYEPQRDGATSDAAAVTDAAIAELDRLAGRRFLLWAHYFDPHMPYRPPAALLDAGDAGAKSRIMDDFDAPGRDLASIYAAAGYAEDEIALARRLYNGEVRYTDREVGRLLAHLQSSGRDRDTVVVVLSDHGESLGEHGLFFAHDFTLYDELVRAVLVWKGPGIAADDRDDEVSLVDVTPTLCRLAALECPAGADGRDLFGGNRTARTLFAASTPRRTKGTAFARLSEPGLAGRWTMALRDGKKLLRIPSAGGPGFELYDLVRDPGETRNLAGTESGLREALRTELDAWSARMDRERPQAPAPRRAARRDRQTLRSLGYLQ